MRMSSLISPFFFSPTTLTSHLSLSEKALCILVHEIKTSVYRCKWRGVIAYDPETEVELVALRKRYECWKKPERLFCMQSSWSWEVAIERANKRLLRDKEPHS
jgi:hypothetical protein